MIRTYGLTHISLQVKDLDRSFAFYHRLFGARVMYQTADFIQVQTPGSHDIIVLEKTDQVIHQPSGILHFGFRLIDAMDIETLTGEIREAGGKVRESGEFVAGEPYVFFFDPDGYEIEVWYEKLPPELSSFN